MNFDTTGGGRTVRVYVGGPLSGPTAEYISNCHLMMKLAEEVRLAGFSVYIPCVDFLHGLVFGYLQVEDLFLNSQPWLAASDAMIVQTRRAGQSKGLQREIETCRQRHIPVFYELADMVEWANKRFDRSNGRYIYNPSMPVCSKDPLVMRWHPFDEDKVRK